MEYTVFRLLTFKVRLLFLFSILFHSLYFIIARENISDIPLMLVVLHFAYMNGAVHMKPLAISSVVLLAMLLVPQLCATNTTVKGVKPLKKYPITRRLCLNF